MITVVEAEEEATSALSAMLGLGKPKVGGVTGYNRGFQKMGGFSWWNHGGRVRFGEKIDTCYIQVCSSNILCEPGVPLPFSCLQLLSERVLDAVP